MSAIECGDQRASNVSFLLTKNFETKRFLKIFSFLLLFSEASIVQLINLDFEPSVDLFAFKDKDWIAFNFFYGLSKEKG